MAGMITANTAQWKVGVSALVPRCAASAKRALREKTQAGFDRSQQVVPVRTGALRDSGRMEERDSLLTLEIDVIYGDDVVDYAGWVEIFEPYLEPSMVEGVSTFDSDGGSLEGPFD